ncbi:hypothetical protein E4U17_003795 [Claviceps sp. LM77 group G4]|nr:hypothetical protein E4U17_003795 [Claviceps sp. LM77 group G4]KAG6071219.1 hypothetical protein E4U33_003831 [Claviceps sp. LM78 group G4]KAG6074374.1 hypothetical protein E4U16_003994 [Claviceps sp. LM84 group G4]
MYAANIIGLALAIAMQQPGAVARPADPVDVQPVDGDFIKLPWPPATQTLGCTTTLYTFPPFIWGPTRTIWTTTTTSTDYIECGPCTAVTTSVVPDGPGPVVHFNTTITEKKPSPATAFACATSEGNVAIILPPHTPTPTH